MRAVLLLSSLEVVEEEQLAQNARKLGELFRAKMQEIEAGLEIACVEILRVGNMLNITRGFHFLSNFLLQCTAVIQPNFMDVEGGVTCEGKASSKYKFSNWL